MPRSSTSKEKNPSASYKKRGRWQVFSTFERLQETPPAVTTASLGALFELDVEKAIVSVESEERKL